MKQIVLERLSNNNFNSTSLDTYNRYQDTTVNLRIVNGRYVYVEDPFFENWDSDQLRERAQNVLDALAQGSVGVIAKEGDRVVGFAYLGSKVLGSEKQYIDLIMFHVSSEYRNQGIGRKMFAYLCNEARKMTVKKLYISANSAKETQEAYRALGCVFASEIIEEIASHEPLDIQLEYIL